jgi:hypothetical protein
MIVAMALPAWLYTCYPGAGAAPLQAPSSAFDALKTVETTLSDHAALLRQLFDLTESKIEAVEDLLHYGACMQWMQD